MSGGTLVTPATARGQSAERASDYPGLPVAAVQAALTARTDTIRGKQLRVTLLTADIGSEVWERFGHNLLWIHNAATGEDIAWNWGVFSFDEPGFTRRFLFGDTRYRVDSVDVGVMLAMYARRDRGVIAQELALAPGERAALDAFVRVNVRDENKFYRYDYFLDNCSTRIRDLLDLVLDGAVRAQLTQSANAASSYRREALRLVQHNRWLYAGMDFALGPRADRPLTLWDASYIPMRFRDAVRGVRVTRGAGAAEPLVIAEREMVVAQRAPAPAELEPRSRPWGALVVAGLLLLGALGAIRAAITGRSWGHLATTTYVITHTCVGVLGAVLLFVWWFTRHAFWAWNVHALFALPLSLVAAGLALRRATSTRMDRIVQGYHMVMAAVALCVTAWALIMARTHGEPATLLALWGTAASMTYLALFGYAMASTLGRGVAVRARR